MLSRRARYKLVNAKAYFEEYLYVGVYCSEGEMIIGQWFAATRMSWFFNLSQHSRIFDDSAHAKCRSESERRSKPVKKRQRWTAAKRGRSCTGDASRIIRPVFACKM